MWLEEIIILSTMPKFYTSGQTLSDVLNGVCLAADMQMLSGLLSSLNLLHQALKYRGICISSM